MGCEFFLILANCLPMVEVPRLDSFDSLRVAAVALILVVGLNFLLIDVDDIQVESADFPAAILEPENLQEVVHVERILASITLE